MNWFILMNGEVVNVMLILKQPERLVSFRTGVMHEG